MVQLNLSPIAALGAIVGAVLFLGGATLPPLPDPYAKVTCRMAGDRVLVSVENLLDGAARLEPGSYLTVSAQGSKGTELRQGIGQHHRTMMPRFLDLVLEPRSKVSLLVDPRRTDPIVAPEDVQAFLVDVRLEMGCLPGEPGAKQCERVVDFGKCSLSTRPLVDPPPR